MIDYKQFEGRFKELWERTTDMETPLVRKEQFEDWCYHEMDEVCITEEDDLYYPDYVTHFLRNI